MADATHETKIVIKGDEKPAVGALTRVTKALHGVRSAVSKVMSAFGLFGLAMEGWRKAVELVQSLNERLHAAAKAAAELKYAETMNAANAALDGSIDRQKRLNDLLKEHNEEISRTNELRELEERNMREIEDARRAANRAAEIAGVSDPRRRMEIQQQWRVEDEQRAKADRLKAVGRQAAAEEDKASDLNHRIRRAQEEIEDIRKAKKDFGTANLGNGVYYETGSEQFKARSETLAKFDAQIKAIGKSIEEWTKQRDLSQAKANELYAHEKRLEGIGKLTPAGWKNVDETMQFDREEAKKKAEEQERNAKKAKEESDRKEKKEASDLKKRQDEQRRIEGEQIGIAASRNGDRLTAMGLGSGVAQSTRQNWKTVIDLLKKQIQVTQDNKPIEQSTVFE